MSRQYPAGSHPDPRVANLPKWAQQRLSHLEARLEEAEARLNVATDRDHGTVWIDSNGFKWTPVTVHRRIRITSVDPDGPERISDGFDIAIADDGESITVRTIHSVITVL